MLLQALATAFVIKKIKAKKDAKKAEGSSNSADLISAAKNNVASRKAENSDVTEMTKEIEKLKEENARMEKQQQTAQNYVIAPPPRHYGRPPVPRGHHRPAPQPQHNPFSGHRGHNGFQPAGNFNSIG